MSNIITQGWNRNPNTPTLGEIYKDSEKFLTLELRALLQKLENGEKLTEDDLSLAYKYLKTNELRTLDSKFFARSYLSAIKDLLYNIGDKYIRQSLKDEIIKILGSEWFELIQSDEERQIILDHKDKKFTVIDLDTYDILADGIEEWLNYWTWYMNFQIFEKDGRKFMIDKNIWKIEITGNILKKDGDKSVNSSYLLLWSNRFRWPIIYTWDSLYSPTSGFYQAFEHQIKYVISWTPRDETPDRTETHHIPAWASDDKRFKETDDTIVYKDEWQVENPYFLARLSAAEHPWEYIPKVIDQWRYITPTSHPRFWRVGKYVEWPDFTGMEYGIYDVCDGTLLTGEMYRWNHMEEIDVKVKNNSSITLVLPRRLNKKVDVRGALDYQVFDIEYLTPEDKESASNWDDETPETIQALDVENLIRAAIILEEDDDPSREWVVDSKEVLWDGEDVKRDDE